MMSAMLNADFDEEEWDEEDDEELDAIFGEDDEDWDVFDYQVMYSVKKESILNCLKD